MRKHRALIKDTIEQNLMDYYKYSIEEHTGGGIIGGIFCKVFCPSVGIAGAYVIVILLAVMPMVLSHAAFSVSWYAKKQQKSLLFCKGRCQTQNGAGKDTP
mgnify:CR=1 FL=1